MRNLVRMVLIAAVTLLALVLVFIRLMAVDTPPPVTAVVFQEREPTDVDRLAVINTNGGFTISFNSALGGYDVDDIPADLVDMDAFVSLLTHSGSISALTKLQPSGAGIGVYGLDKPSAQVNIAYSDGMTFSFDIGAMETISGDYYMRVDGGASVYMMAAENAKDFLAPKERYVSHNVTPELAAANPLSAVQDVTFSGSALQEPIVIQSVGAGDADVRMAAMSFGAATHLVRGRGVHELDQNYGMSIIGSLLGIKAVSVRGYSLTAADIAAMGFGSPYMTAEFGLKNGTEDVSRIVLSIVKTPEGDFLAHVAGRAAVYVIAKPAFADISYPKLILRWFLSPLLLDISEVTVETGTQKVDIAYTRASNSDQTAIANGQAVDIALFQAFYRLITSASSDGEYLPDAAPSGMPELTITYRYKDGAKADDVIRLYPGGMRRMLAEVNGVTEFDIRESFAIRVAAACEALLAGTPIEESW